MSTDDSNIVLSPEPLELLLTSLHLRTLLEFVKSNANLERTVFQGFPVKEASLAKGPVRARLLREARRSLPLAEDLYLCWEANYGHMLDDLDAEDFSPSAKALAHFYDAQCPELLHYALLHSAREDVRAWAERLPEIAVAFQEAMGLPSPGPKVGAAPPELELADLQRQVRALKRERDEAVRARDALQKRVEALEGVAAAASQHESLLLRQAETARKDAEDRLQREQRRAKKAEEDVDRLKRDQRKSAPKSDAAATVVGAGLVPAQQLELITQAVELLQRALTTTTAEKKPSRTPAPAISAPQPSTPSVPVVTPPQPIPPRAPARPSLLSRNKTTPAQLLAALYRNETEALQKVREWLARLGKKPALERAALLEYTAGGVPEALLTCALRPAVLDGSNIANMSSERRAHIEYLAQARQAAWEEGYFPVTIIVDASLRHQIDQADQLMTMVERGEIIMAEPGTSADRLLIDEARRSNAVIITNDRMHNWPEAKGVEKRHAVVRRGSVFLGDFHNSSQLF